MPKLNQALLNNPEVVELLRLFNSEIHGKDYMHYADKVAIFISKHTTPKVILVTEDGVSVTDQRQIVYGALGYNRYMEYASTAAINPDIKWYSTRGALETMLKRK